MRRPELDHILNTMLDSQPEVSDLLFTVDKPLQVESFGELKPVTMDPPLDKLTPYQTEMIALNLVGENQWHLQDLMRKGSCDTAYHARDKARFRVNVFSQRGNYSIVCRKLNTQIPTLDDIATSRTSCKKFRAKRPVWCSSPARPAPARSTTLAAILNEVNLTKAGSHRHARRPGGIRHPTIAPPSTSANKARISTTSPTDCAPPCARRPRSFSSGKCATAKPSALRSAPRKPAIWC
jgi:twitching motility protein PilT